MKKTIQNLLLGTYGAVASTGLLNTRPGRAAFLRAYWIYKNLLESEADSLKPYVKPDAWVIDVGANVGYYTQKFAAWVTDSSGVIAIEPEQANADSLRALVSRRQLQSVVEVIQAVAAELDGELKLHLNPIHPADHRIGTEGIPTPAVTLDGLLAARNWPDVCLVKIDVQGAELRVLQGSVKMITRQMPAICLEIDDKALSEAGTSSDELIEFLRARNYLMYGLHKGAIKGPLSNTEATCERQALGYADFIFLRDGKQRR